MIASPLCEHTGRGKWRRAWRAAFVLLVLAVVYLSLRPIPDIVTVPGFPHSLAVWLDGHDFVKNVIGFSAVAFAGFQAFLPEQRTASMGRRLAGSFMVIVFLVLLVLSVELAQTGLPRRMCEPDDLAAGSVGVFLAWVATALIRVP